jgi:mannonate dehydratase
MKRRDLLKGLAVMPAAAAQQFESRTRGLPPLLIKDAKVIATSPGGQYQWVFLKVITSEPDLYGLGSCNNAYLTSEVIAGIRDHLAPFLIGKDANRIEDLWQSGNVRSYWRNSTVHNVLLSAVDEALWDIKGKRANMPVYEMLGGKARDAVPLYAHAQGRDQAAAEEDVRRYMEQGYRHVRVQIAEGYGGGGFIPKGQGSRPEGGYQGSAFDEELYCDNVPKAFDYLRSRLGFEVKLLHDVHEHLTPTMAVEFAKRMEPYRMFFVEDILPPEQIEWFRNIRKATTTPMAMGELFTHPLEYRPLITERLIDFVRCRVTQIGGITQAKKIAAVCEACGVRTAFQEGGENDPVNQLASYHVDISSTSFGIQEENHFPALVHEMMPGTAELRGGYLYGSDRPGLGIDINEPMAAKYPLRPARGGGNWTTVRGVDGSVVKP